MVKVKICGITTAGNAILASELGADYLGFNFYKESPRFIDILSTITIIDEVQSSVKKVGVFVNEDIDRVRKVYERCELDYVQLHGDESPEYCNQLKHVIKAFGIGDSFDLEDVKNFDVDYYLFDTYDKDFFGGTGKTFDWRLLNELNDEFFLAGGLDIENVNDAIKVANPYAIDICSGVESTPGIKDPEKLRRLFEVLK